METNGGKCGEDTYLMHDHEKPAYTVSVDYFDEKRVFVLFSLSPYIMICRAFYTCSFFLPYGDLGGQARLAATNSNQAFISTDELPTLG